MKVPILRLRNMLLTSLQGEMTDSDFERFRQDLLDRVAEKEILGVIIDISALDVVDSYMARMFSEVVRMVQLQGSHAVICGMKPMVAVTLVEMGRGLNEVETALNLDQSVDKLIKLHDIQIDLPERFMDTEEYPE
ncbi:STAS domain-containing protein [Magnetococcales bacterium HHB-1]